MKLNDKADAKLTVAVGVIETYVTGESVPPIARTERRNDCASGAPFGALLLTESARVLDAPVDAGTLTVMLVAAPVLASTADWALDPALTLCPPEADGNGVGIMLEPLALLLPPPPQPERSANANANRPIGLNRMVHTLVKIPLPTRLDFNGPVPRIDCKMCV